MRAASHSSNCHPVVSAANAESVDGEPPPYKLLLQECTLARSLTRGILIHARLSETGRDRETVFGNQLLQLYAKCGDLQRARDAFHNIERKNRVSWTMMLAAYVDHGEEKLALRLFRTMNLEGAQAEVDVFTLSCVLNACSNLRARSEGEAIHARLIASGFELDVPVQNALLTMYAKSRSVRLAAQVFDSMAEKDLISWNAILLAYQSNSMNAEAYRVYLEMSLEGLQPNSVTFVAVIGALSELGVRVGAAAKGRAIQERAASAGLATDTVLQNALISMYSKCGCLDEARQVFDAIGNKSPVSWTSMIAAYAHHDRGDRSLELFFAMSCEGVQPDEMTLSAVLAACCQLPDRERGLAAGKGVHDRIRAAGLDSNPVVGTALVCMYARCGSLEEARATFDKLTTRDLISWNAMIAAYVEAGDAKRALEVHRSMRVEGVRPDAVTFAGVLAACTVLEDAATSRALQAEVATRGLDGHTVSGTALVCMLAKRGELGDASRVFERMLQHATLAVAAWNSILGALAKHGHAFEAVDLFREMASAYVQPDEITFTAILHACSHSGLLATGLDCFSALTRDFGLKPTVEHFVCLVDLLGRAGMGDEAEDVIRLMPFEPDTVAWKTLLSACQTAQDGLRAAKNVVNLQPSHDAPYVLLSNILPTKD